MIYLMGVPYYGPKNVIFLNLTCDTNRKCYICWFLKADQSKVRALEKVRKLLNWHQNKILVSPKNMVEGREL